MLEGLRHIIYVIGLARRHLKLEKRKGINFLEGTEFQSLYYCSAPKIKSIFGG